MLDAKFPTNDVWKNVAVAFTRCNACDRTWKAKVKDREEKMKDIIKEWFPKSAGIDVPTFYLGGLTEPEEDGESPQFQKLWEFIQSRERLDTSNLQPFEDA